MLEDVVLGNWHYNSFISSVARKSGNCCHLSVEFAVVRRLMLDSMYANVFDEYKSFFVVSLTFVKFKKKGIF